MLKKSLMIASLMLTVACAGNQKACAQMSAGNFGSDWLVVQLDTNGKPFNCWKLKNAVVESTTGGNVDWLDTNTGHLVHLTGWENRVQVANGDFAGAARLLGVDDKKCGDGVYPAGRTSF